MNKLHALEEYLASISPVAVAVSGGVDSMTLAYVAHRVDSASRMFHALSPAVPPGATERVERYARREGWQLELVDAGEINDPRYLANPANRCYFCKTNLYDTVTWQTTLPVVSGTNTDDLGDYRPGLIAADEHRVRHPYVETGIDKRTLRDIAKSLGLHDLCDLPAAPCLSSRVTTGIAIDPDMLPLIDRAEQALWEYLPAQIALTGVRCRIRPGAIGVELETADDIDADSAWAKAARRLVADIFRARGHHRYADNITVEPYRRGSAFLIETLQVN
jgi:uncharacterized protein